jgi:hypothetical protein
LLTLYTTPVVYIWFDRLATRIRGTRMPQHMELPEAGVVEPGD